MKLSDIASQLISLAVAANQARATQGSEDDSPILTSGGYTPEIMPRITSEERRFRDFLEAQPPSVIYMLTAIMYLGRGDFEAKDLPDQFLEVSETFGNSKSAVRQMLGKTPLPQYLDEGLRKLDRAGLDVDKLLTSSTP